MNSATSGKYALPKVSLHQATSHLEVEVAVVRLTGDSLIHEPYLPA